MPVTSSRFICVFRMEYVHSTFCHLVSCAHTHIQIEKQKSLVYLGICPRNSTIYRYGTLSCCYFFALFWFFFSPFSLTKWVSRCEFSACICVLVVVCLTFSRASLYLLAIFVTLSTQFSALNEWMNECVCAMCLKF